MKRLVIGIGNSYRRDDALGLLVARQLKNCVPPEVTVVEASGEGCALTELWRGAEHVTLIDAVSSGGAPGTIHRLDAHASAIPTCFFHYSTHAFSVAEAIELARVMNELPPQLILYGIEGKDFDAGIGLSREVELAMKEVQSRILQEVTHA